MNSTRHKAARTWNSRDIGCGVSHNGPIVPILEDIARSVCHEGGRPLLEVEEEGGD